jgi:transcriptional regulator with XRE-family HTH domain
MTIAKKIRDLRYAKGWGPDELASRAEISRTALYQIECGKTETPRAGTLKRIARALDVTIESLLVGEDGAALNLSPYLDADIDDVDATFIETPRTPDPDPSSTPAHPMTSRLHPSREADLHRKFHELLVSPMAESIARIVEESYRLVGPSRSRIPG